MEDKVIEKPDKMKNSLRSRLVIIETLIFLIPSMAVVYFYYQKQISIDVTQALLFIWILTLALGGMMMLRQVFNRITMVHTLMKKVEEGEECLLDFQNDIDELDEITMSANNLMKNSFEITGELQLKTEEIAERKKIETALQRAKEAAETANIAKGRFLANMSHEFLTPLNAVIGFSQILLTQNAEDLDEKQIKYVSNIQDSGQHLLNMVKRVLELSKIESEIEELEMSEFDPNEELQNAFSMVQGSADKKNISLSLDIQSKLPSIVADQKKFRQIVFNLLDNAVKFTADHGEIYLTADVVDGSKLKAQSRDSQHSDSDFEPNRDWIQISVQDNGIGIKPEDQERIFSIFEQVDTSTKRLFGGTGLGLAMSRKLVELHKGNIWVESEGEQKGSLFSFALSLNA
jgi:signal transduction histidine kinase